MHRTGVTLYIGLDICWDERVALWSWLPVQCYCIADVCNICDYTQPEWIGEEIRSISSKQNSSMSVFKRERRSGTGLTQKHWHTHTHAPPHTSMVYVWDGTSARTHTQTNSLTQRPVQTYINTHTLYETGPRRHQGWSATLSWGAETHRSPVCTVRVRNHGNNVAASQAYSTITAKHRD